MFVLNMFQTTEVRWNGNVAWSLGSNYVEQTAQKTERTYTILAHVRMSRALMRVRTEG